MSQKKNYLYEIGRQSAADYFFLLGHCERMAILSTLDRFGPTSFKGLLLNSPLSKSSLTHHIKLLKGSRLINSCQIGKGSGYSLNEEAIGFATRLMKAYLSRLGSSNVSAKAA